MRDGSLAERLGRTLFRSGCASTWVASLPEAIGALDRHFSLAVACTLHGRTPSLMDLETLLAYQAIGHPGLTLPPTPVWALTPLPAAYAEEIEALDLPVHLCPSELGSEGLVAQMLPLLRRRGSAVPSLWEAGAAPGAIDALLALEGAEEADLLSRYLASRGIRARAVSKPRDAVRVLRRQPVRVLVSEAFDGRRDGQSYWREVEERWQGMPVLFIGTDGERLGRLSPLALPRGTAGALCRPIPAGVLASTLRRLLRFREADAAVALPWVGSRA